MVNSPDANFDLIRYFLDQYQKEVKELKKINILIAGKTGVGKSTLINAVFRENLAQTGVGVPVTQNLNKISKEGIPLVIYDTKGLELSQESQEEVRRAILEEISKPERKNNPDELMHICWYCVNALSNRIEPYEIEWIRDLAGQMPLVLVLTQSLGDQYRELFYAIEDLNLPISALVPVLAKPYKLSQDLVLDPRGLQELVDRTLELVPEALQTSFINAQKVDNKRKLHRANKAVLGYTSSAFATGFTPVPVADAAILVPMQVAMIAHLTSIFGLPLDKALLSSIISAVIGTGGATFLGRTISSSLLKLIPGLGSTAGGAITGATAATITCALGYAYNKVLYTYMDKIYRHDHFDKETFMTLLKEAFKAELKKQTPNPQGSESASDKPDKPPKA